MPASFVDSQFAALEAARNEPDEIDISADSDLAIRYEFGDRRQAHRDWSAGFRFDGGDKNVFDPDNGYRDEYKRIRGVK